MICNEYERRVRKIIFACERSSVLYIYIYVCDNIYCERFLFSQILVVVVACIPEMCISFSYRLVFRLRYGVFC